MPIVADAAVAVRADMKGFDAGFKAAETKTKTFGQKVNAALNPKNIAGGLGAAFLGSQVVGFLNDSAAAASNLEEAQSKVNVVFADGADDVTKWAEGSAEGFLMSKSAALEAVGTYGNLLQAFGVARPAATEMSKTLVELAADLASFNNTSVEDALLAIRSGLSGEAEPLKRYGVGLNQARLEQVALNEGIWDGVGALDSAQKAQAAYALILQDTALAQGDVARTGDGLANSQREMAAKIENAMADIGKAWASIQLGAIRTIEFLTQPIDISPIAMDFGEQADRIHGIADDVGISFDTMKNRIRDRMTETGEDFDTAAGAIEAHWHDTRAAVTLESELMMHGITAAIMEGAPPIEKEWERIASMPTGALQDEYNTIRDAAFQSMVEYAKGVMLGQDGLQVAIAATMQINKTEMTKAEEVAKLSGQLLTLNHAAGVASAEGRIASVNAINATIALITGRLEYLTGQAYTSGGNLASSYAAGIINNLGVVSDAGRQLGGALGNQISVESEPPDHSSPLYGITKWGGNIVKTIAGGINAELGLGTSAARNLAGSLVPGLGGVGMAPSVGRGGSAGGVGNQYHVHLEDKLQARTVTDIGNALRRLGEAGLLPGSLTPKP